MARFRSVAFHYFLLFNAFSINNYRSVSPAVSYNTGQCDGICLGSILLL